MREEFEGPMMTKTHYLAGDWGTSRLRLALYATDSVSRIIRFGEGPGVKQTEDFEAVFVETANRLWPQDEPICAYMAGMVGANIGWRETPYAPCPVSAQSLTRHGVEFRIGNKFNIFIAPGASCVNYFGCHDVMRGEETQIIGVLRNSAPASGRRLICLPGTHTKWALVEDANLLRFETSLQGELFEVLDRHTILTKGFRAERSDEQAARTFDRAVILMRDQPEMSLSQALFMTRSLSLLGDLSPGEGRDFLSGLIIGADARDIPARFFRNDRIAPPVMLVGDPALTRLYARAFDHFDIAATEHDGGEAVTGGLNFFREQKKLKDARHEAC